MSIFENYNKLFDTLQDEEKTEEHEEYLGDNLLGQFYCGNFSSSVKEMKQEQISCSNLIEFLDHIEEHYGKNDFTEWFDRKFFAELGRLVNFN